MRIGASMRSARSFASVEWDGDNRWHWLPTGEQGTEPWGRFLGARWLRFSLVAQRFVA